MFFMCSQSGEFYQTMDVNLLTHCYKINKGLSLYHDCLQPRGINALTTWIKGIMQGSIKTGVDNTFKEFHQISVLVHLQKLKNINMLKQRQKHKK